MKPSHKKRSGSSSSSRSGSGSGSVYRNKDVAKTEQIEDTTLYGEFISSFDQWMTSSRQTSKARHMADITAEISPAPEKSDK